MKTILHTVLFAAGLCVGLQPCSGTKIRGFSHQVQVAAWKEAHSGRQERAQAGPHRAGTEKPQRVSDKADHGTKEHPFAPMQGSVPERADSIGKEGPKVSPQAGEGQDTTPEEGIRFGHNPSARLSPHMRRASVPRFHYPADPWVAETRLPLRLPRTVRLLFAGDLMQHTPQVEAARQSDGTFDYGSSFACVAPIFHEADLAVVNLETTLAPGPPYTGYPCFRSPAALADAIRALGADVCLLANNHCCDGGARGVHTTIAALDRAGVVHTGVFADSADYRRHHPLRLQVGEVSVALLNYTYGTNGLPVPAGVIVNRIDPVCMARDLAAARAGGTDVVAVCIHWGEEYARQENAEQRRLAAFLRRKGADLVIGSHPHVVQPFHAEPEGVVFYSLGNFVSNQRRRYCDGGIAAAVEVVCPAGQRPRFAAEAIPLWVQVPGYRILPPAAPDTVRLDPAARRAWELFRKDTYNLLRDSIYR